MGEAVCARRSEKLAVFCALCLHIRKRFLRHRVKRGESGGEVAHRSGHVHLPLLAVSSHRLQIGAILLRELLAGFLVIARQRLVRGVGDAVFEVLEIVDAECGVAADEV